MQDIISGTIIFLTLLTLLITVVLIIMARIAKKNIAETIFIPSGLRKSAYFRVAKESKELFEQINSSLKASGVSQYQRENFETQIRDAQKNFVQILNQLDKTRRAKIMAKKSINQANAQDLIEDMQKIEDDLSSNLNRIHEMLLGVQANLLKVDVARGGKPLDQMMSDLGEMNAQLADSASAYADLQEGDLEREMRKNRMSK
ncbi:MAG TPA: hypothetical protein PLW39_01935 [Thermoflexales bacterium]|nr:hypothetical protein [Thermoflexales bacterium]